MASQDTAPSRQVPSHRTGNTGLLIAVVVLVVGVFVLAACGDDDSAGPAFVAGEFANTVVIDGEETNRDALTDRQLEMVEIARNYVNAWIDNDGDAVASFMTSNGFVELLGQTYRADDGTLQEWVEGTLSEIPNELNDPLVVSGDQIVLVGYSERLETDWMITLRFTGSGEVQIESDSHLAL